LDEAFQVQSDHEGELATNEHSSCDLRQIKVVSGQTRIIYQA